MADTIVRGKIQDYNRSDVFDDDGNKLIRYQLKVNNKMFTVSLPAKTDVYFETGLDVVLLVNESNVAVAGLSPKKGFKWGNASVLKNEVKERDNFEFVQGFVIEKRRESFNVNKGTSSSAYLSNSRTIVNHTIVLKEKTFRVTDLIGKEIGPNTEIAALLRNDIAYIVKDKTNNKVHGKPGNGFVLASVLLVVFNIAMIYAFLAGKQAMFTSYNRVLVIGNIVFGLAFLFSFTGYVSERKTMRVFNELLGENS